MAWVSKRSVVVPSVPWEIRVYFGADLQIGSVSSDKWMIRNWVNQVCGDERSMWCLLGDIEDDDRPTTRAIRRSAFAARPEVLKSDQKKHIRYIRDEVLPILAPLAQRPSLGVLAGHHWTDLGELNSTQYICNALSAMGKERVPYLGQMSAWVRMVFSAKTKIGQHKEKVLHIQHGVGGGKTIGAALNALKRTSEGFYADAYIRAHDCTLTAAKFDVLAPVVSDKPGIRHRTVVLMNVGSATRGYDITLGDPSYPEMSMMNPKTLGWGMLRMRTEMRSRLLDKNRNLDVGIKAEI